MAGKAAAGMTLVKHAESWERKTGVLGGVVKEPATSTPKKPGKTCFNPSITSKLLSRCMHTVCHHRPGIFASTTSQMFVNCAINRVPPPLAEQMNSGWW